MKKLLIFLLALAGLFIAGGMFLPTQVHVERTIAVNRPAATVFTLLNGYRSFNNWSPWAVLDPEAVYTYSGPDNGPGARMDWSGDPALVGTGWQEITAGVPYERVEMHLDFGPQGVADSYFEIRGDQLGSSVTWGFDTDVSEGQGFFGALLGRYFGLFLDRWVGNDYAQGLAALKLYAESLPPEDFSDAAIEEMLVEPVSILFVSGQSTQQPEEIAVDLAAAYGEITAFITANNLSRTGQPMAITRAWEKDAYLFDAAIPVDLPAQLEMSGNVRPGASPGGPAVRIVHTGPYARVAGSYDALAAYMAARGLRTGKVTWEHYISDPGETPAEEVVTHIYFQVVAGAERL